MTETELKTSFKTSSSTMRVTCEKNPDAFGWDEGTALDLHWKFVKFAKKRIDV